MARNLPTGKAQAVTTADFNERVKRLVANKPDPRKAEPEQVQEQHAIRQRLRSSGFLRRGDLGLSAQAATDGISLAMPKA